jgi:hypothetical protein
MDEFATWKAIPPEELVGMEPGEPVIVFLTEWKKGKRLKHYRKASFQRYSPDRGMVSVDFDNDWTSFIAGDGIGETSICDRNVGRCEIPEHYELHGDFEGYDE